MSDEKFYEMLWDCQFCGTKQNLGLTHRFCPSCGAPQNPDSRYYPSDEDKIEVHDHKYVGVDVTCPACKQLNSAAAEFCGQCGSPLTEAAKAKTLEQESRGAGEQFASMGSRDVVKEDFESEMRRVGVLPDEKKKRGGMNWKLFAIIGLVLAVIAGAFAAFNYTEKATLKVTGHEWERSISIQEYRNFSERNWSDSRPAGDNVSRGSCSREVRSYKQVPDGEECRTVRHDKGDGTFSESEECTTKYRDEPVYDDMCTWTGQRWEDIQPITASGTLSDTPTWPDPRLNCDGQKRIGCEREAGRNENYWVLFDNTEKAGNYKCEYTQTQWEDIQVDSVWTGDIRVLVGGILVCESLKRK